MKYWKAKAARALREARKEGNIEPAYFVLEALIATLHEKEILSDREKKELLKLWDRGIAIGQQIQDGGNRAHPEKLDGATP